MVCDLCMGFSKVQGAFRPAYRKGMSLRSKGIIYITCIRPAMLYGSETWATKVEDIRKMQRSEMRMLRWMTGVSLSERKSNALPHSPCQYLYTIGMLFVSIICPLLTMLSIC